MRLVWIKVVEGHPVDYPTAQVQFGAVLPKLGTFNQTRPDIIELGIEEILHGQKYCTPEYFQHLVDGLSPYGVLQISPRYK